MTEPPASWSTVIRSAEARGGLEQALAWLQQGEVVAFPTDTVYGLGAPMDNVPAVERLYRVKERPHSMAIPLLLAEAEDVERVCRDVPEVVWTLAERFWPGGLTLVLWRRPQVPDLVTAGGPSVAVRLPAHPLPRELARRLQVPLATTSANRSGTPPPTTAAAVQTQLGGRIPLILDGGTCPGVGPSTIVDLTAVPPAILRVGQISPEEVAAVVGPGVFLAGASPRDPR